MEMVLRCQQVKDTYSATIGEEKSRGFTLIEVIVVIVIIGILTALIAPNLTGYIHKLQVEDIVRQAQIMDDELSALTARQYAELGYMPVVGHSVANTNKGYAPTMTTVDEKNYVMLNMVNNGPGNQGGYNYCSGYTGKAPFAYLTIANVQTGRLGSVSATEAQRKSAGLTEFYRQTGIDLSGSAERVPGSGGDNSSFSEVERRWYAIQFYSMTDISSTAWNNSSSNSLSLGPPYGPPFMTTSYLHPDQCYFAFYEVKYNGKWYMVMHNAKYPNGTWNHAEAPGKYSAWVSPDTPVKDEGKWNVYEAVDNTHFRYITLDAAGTPFGVVND